MQSQKCPQCNLVNFAEAQFCKRCKGDLNQLSVNSVIEENQLSIGLLIPQEPSQTPIASIENSEEIMPVPIQTPVIYPRDTISTGDAVSGVLWGIMILIIAVAGLDLIKNLEKADSAPQQAAAAAIAVGFAVIPYCFARAVSECTKSFQGK